VSPLFVSPKKACHPSPLPNHFPAPTFGHVKRSGEGRVVLGTLKKIGASLVLVMGISIILTSIKLIQG